MLTDSSFPTFATALELERRLGVPASWLLDEAAAGRIPSLRVGWRLLFEPLAVEEVLRERARFGGPQGRNVERSAK